MHIFLFRKYQFNINSTPRFHIIFCTKLKDVLLIVFHVFCTKQSYFLLIMVNYRSYGVQVVEREHYQNLYIRYLITFQQSYFLYMSVIFVVKLLYICILVHIRIYKDHILIQVK